MNKPILVYLMENFSNEIATPRETSRSDFLHLQCKGSRCVLLRGSRVTYLGFSPSSPYTVNSKKMR